ncbi:MAG: hypothetical protein ABI602_04245 [Candidatus Saccharibacteria bacterium]
MKARFSSKQLWRYSSLVYAIGVAATLVMLVLFWKTSWSFDGTDGFLPHSVAVRISITFLELLIWLIALRCAFRFKSYAARINKSDDGSRLGHIANGLFLLAAYIMTLTISDVLVGLERHGALGTAAVVIQHYVPLAIALVATVLLYIGSRQLAGLVDLSGQNRRKELVYVATFTLFVALFVANFYAHTTDLMSGHGMPGFDASPNVLMGSYVLPYIISWSLGLLAAVNLARYSYHTPGMIYKRMFRDFYLGILAVMLSIFVAQILMISSSTLNSFGVGIVTLYAVLSLTLLGFALIDRGTNKLKYLEEVT